MAALVLWSENLRGRILNLFDQKPQMSKQNKMLQYKLKQRWTAEMAGLALGVNCGGLEKRKSGLPSLLLAFLNRAFANVYGTTTA